MLVMIDLDNTLVDRAGAVLEWAHEFCRTHDLPATGVDRIVELDLDGYSSRRDVFAALRAEFSIEVALDELLAAYRRRIIELSRSTPGAMECLHEMRDREWQVVIVTNGSTLQQHGKIDALHLRALVDGVVVSEDLGVSKPDGRIFEAAAQLVDADVRLAWMVGDSAKHDIAGAARLGIRTAWLDRGRTWDPADPQPELVVSDLGGLCDAIVSVE